MCSTGRRFGSEVIINRLQSGLPTMKMHRCELCKRWGRDEQIHALTLTHVRSARRCLVDDHTLFDIVAGFVQLAHVSGNLINILNAASVSNDGVLDGRSP